MRPSPRYSAPTAFKLVESLVSLGVLLMCVAILLPTLDRAQRSAKNVRCTANLRLLILGVRHYADHFEGALPGSPWTSSAHLRQPSDFSDPTLIPLGVTAATTDSNPPGVLAPFDWATPTIAELGLVPQAKSNPLRSDRFNAIVNLPVLRCPENRLPAVPIADSAWPIAPAPSYVANLDFLLRAPHPGPATGTSMYVSSQEARLQLYYRPRLRDVGGLAGKVFLVEGSGVLDPHAARISYPTALFTGQQDGGYFAQRRPYSVTSDSTGTLNPLLIGNNADPTINPLSQRSPQNPYLEGFYLLATARHGTSRSDAPLSAYRVNLAFLDGHVENRTILNALDPRLHSPRGTILDVRRETIFPRIILTHLAGKEPSSFVVP